MKERNRTINELRNTLWDCMEAVIAKKMTAKDANAITGAANSIIKGVKLELEYASMAKEHPAIQLMSKE